MNTRADEENAELEIRALYKGFDASTFDSERESLDEWLRDFAWTNHASNSARTYVLVKNDKVIAYYTLASGSVSHEEVVVRIGKGQPKKGKIPVTILARLAVDKTEKGNGYGDAMLKDALLRCVQASELVGSRAVIVHTLDEEAEAFYRKYDFEPSPLNNSTMMMLMQDLKAGLE